MIKSNNLEINATPLATVYVSYHAPKILYGNLMHVHTCFDINDDAILEKKQIYSVLSDQQYEFGRQLNVLECVHKKNIIFVSRFDVLDVTGTHCLLIVMKKESCDYDMIFESTSADPYLDTKIDWRFFDGLKFRYNAPTADYVGEAIVSKAPGYFIKRGTAGSTKRQFVASNNGKEARVIHPIRRLSEQQIKFLKGAKIENCFSLRAGETMLRSFANLQILACHEARQTSNRPIETFYERRNNKLFYFTTKWSLLQKNPEWAVCGKLLYNVGEKVHIVSLEGKKEISNYGVVDSISQSQHHICIEMSSDYRYELRQKVTIQSPYPTGRPNLVVKDLSSHIAMRYLLFSRGLRLKEPTGKIYEGQTYRFNSTMKLTQAQCNCIAGVMSPQPVVVINAPPGSGKSTLLGIALTLMKPEMKERENLVLILSTLNIAVDGIAEKCLNLDFNRIRSFSHGAENANLQSSLKMIKEYTYTLPDPDDELQYDLEFDVYNKLIAARSKLASFGDVTISGGELSKMKENVDRLEKQLSKLRDQRNFGVIATTVSKFVQRNIASEAKIVIIDETSLLSTPELLQIMQLTEEDTRFILVGDSRQLLPKSLMGGQGYSDFGRISEALNYPYRLEASFRSTREIVATWKHFYTFPIETKSKADEVKLAAQFGLKSARLIITDGTHFDRDNGGNPREADMAEMIIKGLQRRFGDKKVEIKVLTFYTVTKDIINERNLGVRARSIDESQGSEADVVILLTSRTGESSTHVNDMNRIIVGLSRAKSILYTILDRKVLSNSKNWEQVAVHTDCVEWKDFVSEF